jgi:ATP-dependent DNA helicase UvrD/PcrA
VLDFLSNLNPLQQQAVQHSQTPLMVIAGPGTGKTSTLVAKILFLIKERQFDPASILAITFTHKAATEIKDRVDLQFKRFNQLFEPFQAQPFISTFHGLAHHFIQGFFAQKKLISDIKRSQLIKELIKKSPSFNFKQLSAKELSLTISKWKNLSLTKGDLPANVKDLVSQYNQQLQQQNLYDYDDLLEVFLTNIKKPSSKLVSQFKYILVDEFQDTNQIQYQILQQLLKSGGHRKITVIGDPKQAIYAFRGAQAQAFDQFNNDFANTVKINLNQNYRSIQAILDLSSKIFGQENKLIAARNDKDQQLGQIQLVSTTNEFSEAEFILDIINSKLGGVDLVQASQKQHSQEEKTTFADFALIYRIHSLARIVEKKLADSGIPFQIVGSDSLYQKSEIRLLILLLRFINQPINQNWQDLVEEAGKSIKIKSALVNKLIFDYQNEKFSLTDLVDRIIAALSLEEKFSKKPAKLRNIYQFKSVLVQFDHPKTALSDFFNYLDHLAAHDYYDQAVDKVTLLTMHAAKGLEFKNVFVIGFEEGLIPYTKKQKDDTEIAEEKRLLYVAMTRAKQGLYLFKTKWRYKRPTQKSQFEALLDKSLIEEIEDENMKRFKKKQLKQKEKRNQLELF